MSPERGRRIFGASTFNWTPDIIAAEREAVDIVVDVVAEGVTDSVELEAGSVWRSFPEPADREVDALREGLAARGGSVSTVGLSLDDFTGTLRPRNHDERLAFLAPQLRAANRVGARGVRLPIGQAGRLLLDDLLPELERYDLVLYEEIQGQQSPASPPVAAALETIAALDDDRVRVLVDISLLMPALPVSYLDRRSAAGLPADLLRRLESEWRDPATGDAVLGLLRSGGVPASIHTLYMNLLIRFGRSSAGDLRRILPLVGAVHLKFWDLDDADGRVSAPLADLAGLLLDAPRPFAGTLTSEWGGHEWLDDADATTLTRTHLALARAALA
ncbi:restriction endonuclease subunit R [Subtercola sp. Z020]|uniref:restriction endonuclease subunit R n=1 Tax=Subtercola sp. Z020 TaxID=2080582 RepID=UPI000CE7BDC0|nr:restriction endonuclease subunit R [Subtercola sp. Z020]PPF89600.1 restriction endonuclease subunit R [Subtercola sp. Z020]